MKLWTVKLLDSVVEITAYSVTRDMIASNVIWADGVRMAFSEDVMYVEEL